MDRRTFLVGALPSALGLSAASQTKRYLYMSTPDASQENYKSGQGILVFDIDDGHKFVRRIDGRFLYLGNQTTVTVFDTKDERIIRQFKDVGERAISPYTVDSRNRICYYCLMDHVGFDVLDLKSGKAPYRVFAGKEHIPHR